MRDRRRRAACAAGLLVLAVHGALAGGNSGSSVEFAGRSAHAAIADDGYRLNAAGRAIAIARQPAKSTTGSVLVDALFALAQAELAQARVAQITDGAFNDGKPLPCECLETGAKWPYVWTRDLAYATDLALFRFDPLRARNGLEFKLSRLRSNIGELAPGESRTANPEPPLYVVQDTGSGGSWPVSTDRIVWFLGARHLLADPGFRDATARTLAATLAQDRRYAFDAARGLYRGETSFLDWREQSYPPWTKDDVVFIAQSFALSTNVLHYTALGLAADLAPSREAAAAYRAQAAALKAAIDRAFWRADRGMYESYGGGAGAPRRIEAYDLLGTALAIVSGVAPPDHARRALANYPTWDAGTPVIWPEQRDPPIYHNRAIWPFVSAYALKAARALDEPARIAHELRSILRGAALAGSNMENYEFTSLAVHVDDGARSGPVVNSPRQLWSVAAMLDAVVEGVFGLGDEDDTVAPKIPRELVPLLFGERGEITLELPRERITLLRPRKLAADANLLVAAGIEGPREDRRVRLRGVHVAASPLPLGRPAFAPPAPEPVQATRTPRGLRVTSAAAGAVHLYVDGDYERTFTRATMRPPRAQRQCFSVTTRDRAGVESLPSAPVCTGEVARIGGDWPRAWTAVRGGRYAVTLDYRNGHGPINTGITAAVKQLRIACSGDSAVLPIVMPHSVLEEASTAAEFSARAGQRCALTLEEGFNMSFLEHYARYTGGAGGAQGALDTADYGDLEIVPLGVATRPPSGIDARNNNGDSHQ